MELQETFNKRRSIRKFKNQEISNNLILQLIESARISPSARNSQPWKFYIAQGKEKDQVAKIMITYAEENDPIKHAGMISTAQAIIQAPVLILTFRENNTTTSERNDTLSIGSAIEHILLKATELKLGSLWICATYNVRHEISKLINTELELYSAIAIGYANEDPLPRPRKDLEDIIVNYQQFKNK